MTTPVTPDTLTRTASELLAARLGDEEAEALAPILDALAGEMQAMRQMDTADAEPAVLYEARP